MKARLFSLAAAMAVLTVATAAWADTTIVDDNFDGYTDTADFQNTWVPTQGNGGAPADAANLDAGILTSDPFSDPNLFPGLQGQAVDHIGALAGTFMVNQYGGVISESNIPFSITPSASESVFVSVDIFDGASGNERMTLGLRNYDPVSGDTVNLLEMGHYNAAPNTNVPGAPTEVTGYAYRVILFESYDSPLLGAPNWQYFALPQELDRPDGTGPGFDDDEIVSTGDIGAGWHRYTALITPDEITFEVDLFRDGKTNTTRDTEGNIEVGVGADGVDASITLPVGTFATGFNSLRIGGPSGLSSAGPGVTAFDNVLLQLIDVGGGADNADFNGDLIVDGTDFLTWQDSFGIADGTAQLSDGDANGDGNVDDADLVVWQAQYGTVTPAVAGVPEPATVSLLLGAVALLAVRRRIG